MGFCRGKGGRLTLLLHMRSNLFICSSILRIVQSSSSSELCCAVSASKSGRRTDESDGGEMKMRESLDSLSDMEAAAELQ